MCTDVSLLENTSVVVKKIVNYDSSKISCVDAVICNLNRRRDVIFETLLKILILYHPFMITWH